MGQRFLPVPTNQTSLSPVCGRCGAESPGAWPPLPGCRRSGGWPLRSRSFPVRGDVASGPCRRGGLPRTVLATSIITTMIQQLAIATITVPELRDISLIPDLSATPAAIVIPGISVRTRTGIAEFPLGSLILIAWRLILSSNSAKNPAKKPGR